MLEGVRAEERRKQAPLVQLTYIVSSALGGKAAFDDWWSGYARSDKDDKDTMPAHLRRDLYQGTALDLLTDDSFEAFRSIQG